MTDTPQQLAVVAFFESGHGDLCVTARAGSGKTTTTIKGVVARPRAQSATLCAFAKRNADDLAARLAPLRVGNVRARTLHGIGFRAITKSGGRIAVNDQREHELAVQVLGEQGDQDPSSELVTAIAKLAKLAKETQPDGMTEASLIDLALDFGLADPGEDADDDVDIAAIAADRAAVAAQVLERSIELTGEVSYADMLWLPIVRRMQPDQTDLVCVDEAQDMGLSQLRLAAKVRRNGGRIVVVGDPRQAIYSWRGAAPGALERVADALKATRLALTVSFRCARAIIEEARKLVPDIEAAPGAIDGVVRSALEPELVASATPGDFVLSRTNADLLRTCLKLIRQGTPAHIVGNDLGAAIAALVRKLARRGASSDPIGDLLARLEVWRAREVGRAMKARRPQRADFANDQADMIGALAEDSDDVVALLDTIDRVFADDNRPRVSCSTVHRAKGLEADRVWILAGTLESTRPRTPLEELEEANIRYVAITRARRELVWTY